MGSRHIVCPHCAATNRVPSDRPAREARCGACHKPLFEGHPASVDGAAFRRHRDHNDIAVLVEVWGAMVGPCRTMAPMYERAAGDLEPDVRLLKVNADEEPGIAAELGVAGIPALFLICAGKVIARTSGAMDSRRTVSWVRAHLEQKPAA